MISQRFWEFPVGSKYFCEVVEATEFLSSFQIFFYDFGNFQEVLNVFVKF